MERKESNGHNLEQRKFWLNLKKNLSHHEDGWKTAEVAQRHCENSIHGGIQSSAGQDWSTWLKQPCFEQEFELENSEGPLWLTLMFDSMLYYVLLRCVINNRPFEFPVYFNSLKFCEKIFTNVLGRNTYWMTSQLHKENFLI